MNIPPPIRYFACSFFLLCCVGIVAGCQPQETQKVIHKVRPFSSRANLQNEIAKVAAKLEPGDTVFVRRIDEEPYGNFTELGDLLRKRIEQGFIEAGVQVKNRGDTVTLMEEARKFERVEYDWEEAAASIIVMGEYVLQGSASIYMLLRIVRVENSDLISHVEWRQPLEQGWVVKAADVQGHVSASDLWRQKPPEVKKGPKLSARLGKSPACYVTGENAEIIVETEAGTFLYIMNIAADTSMAILYPNPILPEKPLVTSKMIFPPRELRHRLQLSLSPLEGDIVSREAFKIVSSRKKLDFSFLPVPMDAIFIGAQGGDIKKVVKVLEKNHEWSEVLLSYMIGDGCMEE